MAVVPFLHSRTPITLRQISASNTYEINGVCVCYGEVNMKLAAGNKQRKAQGDERRRRRR